MKQLSKDNFFLSLCLVVLTSLPLFAATRTVTNTNDSGPGSLRDAITSASPSDMINFSLAYPATITLSSALTIGTSLTISGPGPSNLAISGNNSVGVFVINPGITATISGVTIENGSAIQGGGTLNFGTLTVSNSTLSGNSGSNAGGGIYNFGTLTVGNSTLSGNSAAGGGGIFNYAGSTLTVTNSTLSGNSAPGGGGIFVLTSTLTVTNSTFSGNSASYGGGAIFTDSVVSSVTASVSNSTFSDNSASSYGGGIFNSGMPMTVTNSTLSGNSAPFGGGILNNGIAGTTLTLSNSTLSGNSATSGGGVSNFGFGAVTAKNTIMANSSSGGNCTIAGPGTAISGGHNLSDDATCAFSGTGDNNSTPAGLDPNGLQNNGGPTKTIALLPSSPAVDAIPVSPTNYCTLTDGVTPVATDQRGVARPQGFGCDIGAYELQGPLSTSTTISPSANPSILGQSVTLTATVIASGGTPTGTVTFTDGTRTLGAVPLSSGQAMFTTSSLAAGTHAITAQYNGSTGFNPSSASLSQQVTYGICALYDQTKSVQSGAVFPIKLALCHASGADVSSSAIVLHATAVAMLSTVVGAPQSLGNSNPDSNFRFDSTLGAAGGYILNLSTQGLASGTHSLKFTATGDAVVHSVGFGVN